ncbi:MAG: hypothetical protein AAGC67_07460 [Myxococcota bacterium]
MRVLPPIAACVLVLLVLSMETARAQVRLFPDEFERVDVIAIERDGRQLFAFDSITGGRVSVRLDVSEEVRFEASRGRVGVVVTDRRALGVVPGRPWIELRFRLEEVPSPSVLVEDRIALFVTDRRVLAFNGSDGWVEAALSPNEAPTAVRVGAAVGVVTTPRRALGIAPRLGRFAEEPLQIREGLESVTAQDTLATIRTLRRILVFSAPRGTWTTQRRPLR